MEALHTATGTAASEDRSPDPVPHGLAPGGEEEKSYLRQKRKRTSMEDQSVLEEAYKRDPKPDKAARMEIVKIVNLGEKEVQIWFQNRRQSSRRKSRPLLPHEIAQYQLSRQGSNTPGLTPTPTDGETYVDDEEPAPAPLRQIMPSEAPPQLAPPAASIVPVPELPSPNPSMALTEMGSRLHSGPLSFAGPGSMQYAPVPSLLPFPAFGPYTSPMLHPATPGMSLAFPPPQPDELRRTAATPANSMHPADPSRLDILEHRDPAVQAQTFAPESGRRLKKARSIVRLSMSFDGNASIVTTDGSSPSPPRVAQSQDLVEGAILRQGTAPSPSNFRSNLQRSSSGRARDSRAWEFWCDKDSRTELEVKAEQDSNGSAADAISLLRSSSGRSILGVLPTKRNSLYMEKPADAKRSKTGQHRPALQRSNTSSGRLQSRSAEVSTMKKSSLKHSGSAISVYIPGNESDKENWSPGSKRSSYQPSKTITAAKQSGSTRAVLGEKKNAGNTVRVRSRGQDHGKSAVKVVHSENTDSENDPELASFMHGGRGSNSTSSEADLDCVQGLLSLSQGNWR
ncbi:Homeobox protein yox1 [Elasticomyces elasticus]|nr:Homeobox protein yox1 [Elasticomyces elasticus]